MNLNVSAFLTGAGAVAKATAAHPITKGGSLAALITGGLFVASAAGVAVPEVAFTLGPIAGLLLYRFLPKNAQDAIDGAAEKVVDTFETIPTSYAEYPAVKSAPAGTAITNLRTKDGQVNAGAGK